MSYGSGLPGVEFERRPRAADGPFARTDVVGFAGLEPRVRDGRTPSRLLGAPVPSGHDFNLDVASFQVEVDGRRVRVPGAVDFDLSADAGAVPLADGECIVYALVAAVDGGSAALAAVAAPASAAPTQASVAAVRARAPGDEAVAAALAGLPFARIADVLIERRGAEVDLTVFPALPPVVCEDERDFELAFGAARDDGGALARAVHAFFSNGGRRCHVATVRRPRFEDAAGLRLALDDLVGVPGASEALATGLERLLLIPEVSVVDVPDLYERRAAAHTESLVLPRAAEAACFRSCAEVGPPPGPLVVLGTRSGAEPLFADADVVDAQRRLMQRCQCERWRVLLLLAPPLVLDPADGAHRGPDAAGARAWRDSLVTAADDPEDYSGVALYFPWLLAQEGVGAPVEEVPPTAYVAGVIARRDLARGPHVAPANELLAGVVAPARTLSDGELAALYAAPAHVNPLRIEPGRGVEVWGARTVSTDRWLRYLPVRRCLSAIERRAAAALEPLAFESNDALLWMQVGQLMLGLLLEVFESGALRGETADESFYVRCDESVNPPEQVEQGLLVCEVGVAIAAPAEFLVFRLGRRDGAVDVVEGG